MKLFKLSILAALAFVAGGSINAQQAPDCGTNLNGTLKVGTNFSNGLPWEEFTNGTASGFDIQIACQIQRYLGFANIEFVGFASNDEVLAAVAAGQVTIGISDLAFDVAAPVPGVAFVKYNDLTVGSNTDGTGIAINSTCCQLYANVARVIEIIAENGVLGDLRTLFNVPPGTFSGPIAALVPNACVNTNAALPVRNSLSNFILAKYCLKNCEATNVTGVTEATA